MSKHTPGPWRVIKQSAANPVTWVGGGEVPNWRGPGDVCSFFPQDEKSEANAQLIAAAPEMYRVLLALVGSPPEFGENGMCKLPVHEVIVMAREALKKAEGR